MKVFLLMLCALAFTSPQRGLALSMKGDLTVISTAEVKDCLDKKEDALLIDTMPRIIHQVAHIPGSVNIPLDQIEKDLPAQVPDKNRKIIFYCMGPKCVYTPKAARLAAQMGYKNALAYVDGLPGWQSAGLPTGTKLDIPDVPVPTVKPVELKERLGEFHLIDIRWEERSMTGLIPGTSQWASLMDLDRAFEKLPRDKPLVLYDTADKLARMAGRFLMSKGFQVLRLDGGILNWIGSGLPVEKISE